MKRTPLDELLQIDTLTPVFKRFAEQGSEHTCSRLLQEHGRPLTPAGDTARWDEVRYSRGLAPVTGAMSPTPRTKRVGVRKRESPMAWVKLSKDVPGSALFLEQPWGASLEQAEAVVARELEELALLVANTREYLATRALLGRIEVNPQTIPGSEISFAVDFGTRAALATRPWSDPSTQIRSWELVRLKRIFKDASGLKAGFCLTEPGLDAQLIENREVREFAAKAKGAEVLRNLQLTGPNPQWDGLGGLGWWFTDGTYTHTGQLRRYFPEETVVALPSREQLSQVVGWAEGKVFVPERERFAYPAKSATKLIRELRGTYAYAEVTTNPLGIRLYAGWHGLPVVLDPGAVLTYRTNPSPTAP